MKPEALFAWLRTQGLIQRSKPRLEVLSGGLLNHVWRVKVSGIGTMVVKHAPTYIVSAPDVPLNPSRLGFEGRALRFLDPNNPEGLPGLCSDTIRAPLLLALDEERALLAMEDLGNKPDLLQWLTHQSKASIEAAETAKALGDVLGTFVGQLHARSTDLSDALRSTFHNSAIQQTRFNVQYKGVAGFASERELPHIKEAGVAAKALGRKLMEPGCCLVMGDLWPRSIYIHRDAPENIAVRLLDWEFAHFGNPAQDVAHLAAHLWMIADTRPQPTRELALLVLRAFVEAWSTHKGDSVGNCIEDCAVHFGAEILVRTLGPFREGYLYAERSQDCTLKAANVAIETMLNPELWHTRVGR